MDGEITLIRQSLSFFSKKMVLCHELMAIQIRGDISQRGLALVAVPVSKTCSRVGMWKEWMKMTEIRMRCGKFEQFQQQQMSDSAGS